jgi:hypothetical protein
MNIFSLSLKLCPFFLRRSDFRFWLRTWAKAENTENAPYRVFKKSLTFFSKFILRDEIHNKFLHLFFHIVLFSSILAVSSKHYWFSPSWGRFHQHFKSRFYICRSKMRKKENQVICVFLPFVDAIDTWPCRTTKSI